MERKGREGKRGEEKGRKGKRRERKGREGKRGEEKGREGKGRKEKRREGKGREWKAVSTSFIKNEVKEMTIKNYSRNLSAAFNMELFSKCFGLGPSLVDTKF